MLNRLRRANKGDPFVEGWVPLGIQFLPLGVHKSTASPPPSSPPSPPGQGRTSSKTSLVRPQSSDKATSKTNGTDVLNNLFVLLPLVANTSESEHITLRDMSLSMSVAELKIVINQRSSRPVDYYLVYQGRRLDDAHSLRHYGVARDSTLQVRLQLVAGCRSVLQSQPRASQTTNDMEPLALPVRVCVCGCVCVCVCVCSCVLIDCFLCFLW